jgi:hypothetical protein
MAPENGSPGPHAGSRRSSRAGGPGLRDSAFEGTVTDEFTETLTEKRPEATHIDFDCPVCGKSKGAADWKVDHWVISCWTQTCQDLRGAYLRELADAVGAPNGAVVKDDPLQHLAPLTWGRKSASAESPLASLPAGEQVAGWHDALLASGEPLRYLTDARGVSPDLIKSERLGVGWDSERRLLTFPMYYSNGAGERWLVGFKTRAPKAGARMDNCAGKGRPWPLYPDTPNISRSWVLLVAGELDALRGLSAGLPAVSVTLGASTWRPEWAEELRGRRVLVCFDNNEQRQARDRVRTLRAAGIRAKRLDLRTLGLDAPKGDLSDYLNGGGDPAAMRAAVPVAWRRTTTRTSRAHVSTRGAAHGKR